MPTKSEQTDLRQALYGRNGESPLVVIAATSPTDCFDSAFEASKIALEHMTPVILLTDGYIANGSSAWRIPEMEDYPEINPPYVDKYYNGNAEDWKPFLRNEATDVRYWGIPGTPEFMHRVGGLEKDRFTGVISSNPENHQFMIDIRQNKIERIADFIPEQEVMGDKDAETLIVGWGGTYGHLLEATLHLQDSGKKVAFTQFRHISPLPKNTHDLLKGYKKVIVAEQNSGQFAAYLSSKFQDLSNIHKFNRIEGQPFKVSELVKEFTKIMEEA